MAKFSVAGRAYEIARFRLGEVKAIARIQDEPLDLGSEALLDRFARVVEAGTARFGAEGFRADEDSECTAQELTDAARTILTIAGFRKDDAPGEAAAAAR